MQEEREKKETGRQKRGMNRESRENRGGWPRWTCDSFFLKLGCVFTALAVFTVLSSVLFAGLRHFIIKKKIEQEGEEEAGRDGNPTFPGFFGKCNQRAGAVEGE